MGSRIDVIATTISGSVSDWGKVKRIVPLFASHGEENVNLIAVDSHAEARQKTCDLAKDGSRILISAGGSGTFNSVVEGCYDAGVDTREISIGFLRKGSADLIGKVLKMPDEIEAAIDVFVTAIREKKVIPCDVIMATGEVSDSPPRRFVGYGGGEVFGEIPRFTENRFIKYYKGILSQLFGDLGPFFVGANLAILSKFLRQLRRHKRYWEIIVDDKPASEGKYQALIIVNGDLGPNMPFARGVPLGSGDFHLFAIRDKGIPFLYRQLKHAWDASIMEDPERWGFESFRIEKSLVLKPRDDDTFLINTDGSAMPCRKSVRFEIIDHINLFTA
jgi:diacylglycerol kinase family enzyme